MYKNIILLFQLYLFMNKCVLSSLLKFGVDGGVRMVVGQASLYSCILHEFYIQKVHDLW